jgi:omega-6 fatty acid desaturase (delta-12 desaturase)
MTGFVDTPLEAMPSKSWSKIVARYRTPSTWRSVLEILVTATPLFVIWVFAWIAVGRGQWWAIALSVPAAAFIVRLFMIQHDCGHGSMFKSRMANDWVGRIIGVFTLTPYSHWRESHGVHHATTGNLDRRGMGDVEMLTVDEYAALPRRRRILYRLYRHPLVLFGLAPAYLFFLQQRLPVGFMRAGSGPWLGVMGANLAIAAFIAGGIYLFGPGPFLWVYVPTLMLAATAGVWLFYVQHQFERTLWARQPEWNPHDAALYGSSYYDLPIVLRWFTANIGVHHVHHLNSRIPFYRMSEVLRDFPRLRDIGRMTLAESLATVPLTLWDTQTGRLVSFREAARLLRSRAQAGEPAPAPRVDLPQKETEPMASKAPPIPETQRPGKDDGIGRRDAKTGLQSNEPGDGDVNLEEQGRFGNRRQNVDDVQHRVQDR